ncbi:Eco57I restriction-modification methylase domain-containing protein [Nostoc sp. FACHB-145]|uniref:Eco57I restriction-modification methylase domain-containing protein n=1 Tax=Nostoc sp. FACHB-145 TaxID=2692836 RepID=UPI0016822993|nr:N-6 DNA methylase [Nostoc sp. FACHB-145]MBD2471550.1 N-6 DNA methylase [Nostoc sp. FACHB-145]
MKTTLTALQIEGNLLAPDMTAQMLEGSIKGQSPEDFGFNKTDKLADEIATAWGDAKAYWAAFQRALARLDENNAATSITRELWVVPLLQSLGYDPVYTANAEIVEGQTYAISHRAEPGENKPPIHIIGCRLEVDKRPPSGNPRLSAHALVQEYLNKTEHLWAIATNGFRWRLLRDSSLMTRLTYVEFDLEQILNGENFAEFGLFYRLFHRSRLPEGVDDADKCLLEYYHQEALQQGGRVRDKLRDGVEKALIGLGNGFLQHPANEHLRQKFADSSLKDIDYYRQLLRLIYRLLFLMVAESRNLLFVTDDLEQARIYREYYSIERLRELAERPHWRREGFQDLWQGLWVTFLLFDENWRGEVLGLSPLNGDLFGSTTLPALDNCAIDNYDLLITIRQLSLYLDKTQLRRVNYEYLDVEELGSVYESLLDFYPKVVQKQGKYEFALVFGSDRKTTGSYYTPPQLVQQLIKTALEPVIENKLAQVRSQTSVSSSPEEVKSNLEDGLLSLKICDPACGSGHFLLAAARRVGKELAKVRTGETEPGSKPLKLAIRDVIQNCIYGVDLNPLAVDLCKVALWIEGFPGKLPLSFLDHRIKCGNSLLGVLNLSCLDEGIPDEAYKFLTGDDKNLATQLKKRNKKEKETDNQGQLSVFCGLNPERTHYTEIVRDLGHIPEVTPQQVREKQTRYQQTRKDLGWWRDYSACNLWTAAFLMPLTEENLQILPTTADLSQLLNGNLSTQQIVDAANKLAEEKHFFHWPLEFPEVFEKGGFDCLLGNPPWEEVQLKEQEFFMAFNSEIYKLSGEQRKTAIKQLSKTNKILLEKFEKAKHDAELQKKFFRQTERFKLTATGKLNTYALFAELIYQIISPCGCAGIILPSAIATDDSTKLFIQELIKNDSISSFYDFTNRGYLFHATESTFPFSLLTLSRVKISKISLAAQIWEVNQLKNEIRTYQLKSSEIRKLNPNTLNLPIIKSAVDAKIIISVYERIPIFKQEKSSKVKSWSFYDRQGLFNITSDNKFLKRKDELESLGFISHGYNFIKDSNIYFPLYESKFIEHFNHRKATFQGIDEAKIYGTRPQTNKVDISLLSNPNWSILPRYWASKEQVLSRIPESWKYSWLIGFRRTISAVADSRSVTFTILPLVGVGDSMPVIFPEHEPEKICALLANFNCIVLDYIAKQKASGGNLSFYVLYQLPVITPESYTKQDIKFISTHVLELVYTAWDMQPFAKDMGYDGEPFIWNPNRRALLRAELDAYYAKLYGLTRDELRYILDPADVYGEDFPSETFRVLKNNEIKQFGEYRTQRLVLEAWDRMFG